jgi:hypothetical protein
MTNTQFTNLEQIKSIVVPTNTEDMRKYQAISHIDVIDSIKEEIDRRGLHVQKEVYKIGKFGTQVYGSILTDMKSDNDLGGGIHFVNSYNKSTKLQIQSGSIVFLCSNGMIRMQQTSNFARKHVGAINVEFAFMIDEAFDSLETEYNYFIEAKNKLKEIEVSKKVQAELAGRLFIEQGILSVTQMSALKTQLEKVDTPFGVDNAWQFYNAGTEVLKLSHPVDYIKDHQKFHEFAMEVF